MRLTCPHFIRGQNLFQLLTEIQHERLFAVRAGMPDDPSHPHVESVVVVEPDKAKEVFLR